jgi:ketosteroid isomerase-like protein
MRTLYTWLIIAFTGGSLLPLQAQQTIVPTTALPSVVLPPDLDRVLRDYERAWQARNTEALVSLFVAAGFVMQPQRPPVRGQAGLRQSYQGAGGPLCLRALAFAQSGSVGYIIGAYRYQSVGNDVGKFVLALRRDDGKRWLIAADMDNSIK